LLRPAGNFEFVPRDGRIFFSAVYVENGYVAAKTLAVIDVEKEQNKGGDSHGSKIIVIPFDGGPRSRPPVCRRLVQPMSRRRE
jgi:hypothetical protein